MNTNTELERQCWRNTLFQSLASEGKEREDCENCTETFDRLTDTGMSGQNACHLVFSSNGSLAADWIEKQLSLFNSQSKGINNRPSRLKEVITRFNANIDKLAEITVDNVGLSSDEREKVKCHYPAIMTSKTFESVASVNEPRNRGCKKMTLEIRF